MTCDHATVEEQFEVIDWHDGTQGCVVRQCRCLGERNLITGMLAVQIQTKQGAITHEGPALLQTDVQFFGRGLAGNADEYPIHTYRAAQRSVVRHRIGPCASWETKTKIEQAIPNVGAG